MATLRLFTNQLIHGEPSSHLKWVIIGVVLVIAPVIAFFANFSQKMLILELILLVLMVIAFLRWPPVSLVVLVVISLISPFSLGTGTDTSLSANILLLSLLLGLWLVDLFVSKNRSKTVLSRSYLPLIILLGAITFSFLNGQLPWYMLVRGAPLRAQIGALAMIVFAVGAFVLVAWHTEEIKWLRRMTWAFLIIGALIVIGRIIPQVGQLFNQYYSEPVSHSIFWVWMVAISLSQALFNQQLKTHWRVALFALVISAFYVTLIKGRFWSSGWIPALIAVVGIIWFGMPRLRWLVLAGGVLIILLSNQWIVNFVMYGNDYSWITRLEAWRIVLDMTKASPILGLGPANYRFYTPLFPIMGYYVQFNSHNNFIDIFAQFGLIGLGLFLWFFIEVGLSGLKLRNKVSDGFAHAYLIGGLGGLLGMLTAGMLGDWFLPFVYNIGLSGFQISLLGWMFLGGIVAIEQIYKKVSN
ncbi:MAG TPA: O-antigen ligase family protein [Anaerolineales bacterium]|nr:O-antigen ligase family protein [Anaerolineales bacterium]